MRVPFVISQKPENSGSKNNPMDLYRITITRAPSEGELGSYLSLSPWAGETTKYTATCTPVSVALTKDNPPHFGYTRVSTKEQGDKDNSHPVQREAISAMAAAEGIDPSRVIFACETGKKRSDGPEKRPELQKILANVCRNSRVYVYNRDRLGAGLVPSHVTYLIRQRGGIVLSCEGFNDDNVGHDAYRAIKDVMSQQELRDTSRRVRSVKQSRKRKGLTYCRRKYGYDKVSMLTGKAVQRLVRTSRDEDFRLVRNEREQQVIEFILSQRAKGDSYNNIARHLNNTKTPPPDGTTWHHSSIMSIVRSNSPPQSLEEV